MKYLGYTIENYDMSPLGKGYRVTAPDASPGCFSVVWSMADAKREVRQDIKEKKCAPHDHPRTVTESGRSETCDGCGKFFPRRKPKP